VPLPPLAATATTPARVAVGLKAPLTLAPSREGKAAPVGEVKPTRTQLTAAEAAHHLRRALGEHLGRQPDDRAVAIVTAQWAHETGHGASMYNYNFGGIKGRGPSGLSVAQRTREGFGQNEVTIVDRFRAYQTPEEGALDYVGLLKARYPDALDAAQRGDPSAFVKALRARGYFTGDPAAYERSVSQIASRFASGFVSERGATSPAQNSAGNAPPAMPKASRGMNFDPTIPSSARVLEAGALSRAEVALEALLTPPVPRALVEEGGAVSRSDARPTGLEPELQGVSDQAAEVPLGSPQLPISTGSEGSPPVAFSALTEEVTRAALRAAIAHTSPRAGSHRADRF